MAATAAPHVDSVGSTVPVAEESTDLPMVPVFTVEDLARHSDVVVLASHGRVVDEVQFRPDPNGPERSYSIVEFEVEDVLGSAGEFAGDTVAVWLPQSVVPTPDLPDRYVLFLRHPPRDFDAQALALLATHPNPTILVPGFNSIMECDGGTVSVRSAPFYGLRTADGEPVTGPDGVTFEPPFVLTLALDDVRTVAHATTGVDQPED